MAVPRRRRQVTGDPIKSGASIDRMIAEPPARATTAPNRDTRSPLTDAFPVFTQLSASLSIIPPPVAGFSATGSMALFPLLNVPAETFEDMDVLLTAVHCVLGSCDPVGGQGRAVWGNTGGTGAAIVVGKNIPNLREATGTGASWSSSVVPVGYVDTTNYPRFQNRTGLIFASPFAPGAIQATPGRIDPAEDYPPHVIRFRRDERIQAAFVVPAATAAAAINQSLNFNVVIELRLRLGLTFTMQGLGTG